MASDMNSGTIGGLNAYCDWLLEKSYAGPSQIGPWKVAIRKVFEAVNGPSYEDTVLEGLDFEDVYRRFRVSEAQTYKSETMDAYISRIQRALEAYEYWQQHGKPPVFRQVSRKADDGDQPKKAKKAPAKVAAEPEQSAEVKQGPDTIVYPFPLRSGQVAKLALPQRLEKADVDRMVQFLHALSFEPQQQIPEKTGEQLAA